MFRDLNYGQQQQNYGWGNAIGDIFGAIMKRNNERGIANLLTNGIKPDEVPTQPPPQQQGLLPNGMINTNFAPQFGADQTQTPSVQNIGQQQLSKLQPTQTQPTKYGGLLSPNGTSFDTRTPEQIQQDTAKQAEYAQFAEAKKKDPQWYVGDTYVGDDAQAKADAMAKMPTPAPSITSATATQQPKEQPLSAPNKLDMAKSYSKSKANYVKELLKYGYSAKDAVKSADDQINKQVDEDFNTKSNAYSDQLHAKLDDVTGLDLSTNANKKKAMATVMQINYGLQKIGKPPVDMATFKELLSTDDLNIQKIDTGDGIQYVGISKDGKTITNIGDKMMKSVSPDAQLSANVAMRGQDISAATAAARGGGSGGSRSSNAATTQKMSMYKWASGYSLKPTGEVDIMGKPIMTRVQNNPQLAAQLSQELGYSGQGGGSGGDPRIDQARAAGYSDEEIQQFIGGGGQSQPAPQQVPQVQYQQPQNLGVDQSFVRNGFGGY